MRREKLKQYQLDEGYKLLEILTDPESGLSKQI